VQPDALEFNPASIQQLTQLLFGPYSKKATKKDIEKLNLAKKAAAVKKLHDEEANEFEKDEVDEEERMSSSESTNSESENGDNNKSQMLEILPAVREFRVENIFVKYIF
jgi:hypothetical protein